MLENQLSAADIMARDISSIAEAMRSIDKSRISRKAIVTLIHAHSKVPKKQIEYVLNNLNSMDKTWLKPEPKK